MVAGSTLVWDSLAIAETVAERAPEPPFWPGDPGDRAVARSLCAEMHAGFSALREHMPMNIRARLPGKGRGPGVDADINRIVELWRFARRRVAGDGAFLFGAYGLADIFYAPVALRLRSAAAARLRRRLYRSARRPPPRRRVDRGPRPKPSPWRNTNCETAPAASIALRIAALGAAVAILLADQPAPAAARAAFCRHRGLGAGHEISPPAARLAPPAVDFCRNPMAIICFSMTSPIAASSDGT